MADTRTDRPAAAIAVKDGEAPFEPKGKRAADPAQADVSNAAGAWADEKARANAKHDRSPSASQSGSAADALAVGGGQQSTPYQLETQADAIAKQTRRGNV